MKYNTRFIFEDNTTFYDYTVDLNNFRSATKTIDFVTAQDNIYIGSLLPFNHLYFDVSTANDQASSISIKVWWANDWHDVFDLIDQTKVGNNTLAQSGNISWVVDSFKGWDKWSRNDSTSFDIYTLNIFDFYWIKVSFTSNLKNTTALRFVGQKFSSDESLYGFYPDLNNTHLKTAFAAGKTTWNEQHFQATTDIVDYLNKSGLIISKDQVLEPNMLEKSCSHKCAEIIYSALGKDYVNHANIARQRFKECLDLKSLRVDLNQNGNLDDVEISKNTGVLYR